MVVRFFFVLSFGRLMNYYTGTGQLDRWFMTASRVHWGFLGYRRIRQGRLTAMARFTNYDDCRSKLSKRANDKIDRKTKGRSSQYFFTSTPTISETRCSYKN